MKPETRELLNSLSRSEKSGDELQNITRHILDNLETQEEIMEVMTEVDKILEEKENTDQETREEDPATKTEEPVEEVVVEPVVDEPVAESEVKDDAAQKLERILQAVERLAPAEETPQETKTEQPPVEERQKLSVRERMRILRMDPYLKNEEGDGDDGSPKTRDDYYWEIRFILWGWEYCIEKLNDQELEAAYQVFSSCRDNVMGMVNSTSRETSSTSTLGSVAKEQMDDEIEESSQKMECSQEKKDEFNLKTDENEEDLAKRAKIIDENHQDKPKDDNLDKIIDKETENRNQEEEIEMDKTELENVLRSVVGDAVKDLSKTVEELKTQNQTLRDELEEVKRSPAGTPAAVVPTVANNGNPNVNVKEVREAFKQLVRENRNEEALSMLRELGVFGQKSQNYLEVVRQKAALRQ